MDEYDLVKAVTCNSKTNDNFKKPGTFSAILPQKLLYSVKKKYIFIYQKSAPVSVRIMEYNIFSCNMTQKCQNVTTSIICVMKDITSVDLCEDY